MVTGNENIFDNIEDALKFVSETEQRVLVHNTVFIEKLIYVNGRTK